MISYRHIPTDWNRFAQVRKSKRVISMCGRKVTTKYVGTPAVHPQPLIVNGRPGWCPVCIKNLLAWYKDTYKTLSLHPLVSDVYNAVFSEMLAFMELAVENNFDFDSEKSDIRSSDAVGDGYYHARLYAQRRAAALQGYVPTTEELVKFYGKHCLYPGCEAVKATIDHVVPLSKGGAHAVHNIQPLCKSHNSSKKDKEIDYRTGRVWMDVDNKGLPIFE